MSIWQRSLLKRRAVSKFLLGSLLAWSAGASSSLAISNRVSDFVEVELNVVAALSPKLASTYPNARFLMSGIDILSGEWRFIRVEDTVACHRDACPTIVFHNKTDWKVLINATKEIDITVSVLRGEFLTMRFASETGSPILIRYADGEKTIYVVSPK
jgi:hypothetical protein